MGVHTRRLKRDNSNRLWDVHLEWKRERNRIIIIKKTNKTNRQK